MAHNLQAQPISRDPVLYFSVCKSGGISAGPVLYIYIYTPVCTDLVCACVRMGIIYIISEETYMYTVVYMQWLRFFTPVFCYILDKFMHVCVQLYFRICEYIHKYKLAFSQNTCQKIIIICNWRSCLCDVFLVLFVYVWFHVCACMWRCACICVWHCV